MLSLKESERVCATSQVNLILAQTFFDSCNGKIATSIRATAPYRFPQYCLVVFFLAYCTATQRNAAVYQNRHNNLEKFLQRNRFPCFFVSARFKLFDRFDFSCCSFLCAFIRSKLLDRSNFPCFLTSFRSILLDRRSCFHSLIRFRSVKELVKLS